MKFLLELRLEEGIVGKDTARARLDAWWAEQEAADTSDHPPVPVPNGPSLSKWRDKHCQ